MFCHQKFLRGVTRTLCVVAAVSAGFVLLAGSEFRADAQVPNLSPEQMQQLQAVRNSQTQQQAQPVEAPRETVLEPTAAAPTLPTSDLEELLSLRAKTKLRQFGYDQLGVGRSINITQVGSVQDSYVLGLGDEVVLTLRGQENAEFHALVDRNGNVTFPKLRPVSAAGRNFGDFREELSAIIKGAYVSTNAYVTVGRVRQLNVLVSGEVGSPGVRIVTGLSTVLDALFVSQGIKKSGSLRNVIILRGGRTISVDLYSILMSGVQSKNVTLAEGDKVVVPSIGSVVAVTGEVRRPGIYELRAGQKAVSAREVLSYAGGTALAGSYSFSVLRTMPDGRRQYVDISNAMDSPIRDGEILSVRQTVNISVNQIHLIGAVRSSGYFALGKYHTLHDILTSNEVLTPDAYTLFGIIDRIDPATLQRVAMSFSPMRVIAGKDDVKLQSDDQVRILTRAGMKRVVASVLAKERRGSVDPSASETQEKGDADSEKSPEGNSDQQPTSPTNIDALRRAAAGNPAAAAMLAGVGQNAAPATSGAATSQAAAAAAGDAGDADADGMFFGLTLGDQRVLVSGAANSPGWYLVAPNTTLADLIAAFGGLTHDADLSEFEITSTAFDNNAGVSKTLRATHSLKGEDPAQIVLKPLDRLKFRRVFSDVVDGEITVDGEVRYPGTYSILRSERLSSVLSRAGGPTAESYPEGAVFIRKSVAVAEERERQVILSDMRSQLLTYLVKPQKGSTQQTMNAESVVALQALIQQLEALPALGRVPVVADARVLEKHPELDILLEPGDRIVFPRRPSSVLVMGEVIRPGAQRFNGASSPSDYIDQAGGTTDIADDSRIIVVLPDGSVRSNRNTWLNFGFDTTIPAGTTIYVPRKIETYPTSQMVTDAIQILAQLATSAASAAALAVSLSKQ